MTDDKLLCGHTTPLIHVDVMSYVKPQVLTTEQENELKNQFLDAMEEAIKSDSPRIIIDSFVPEKDGL